MIVICYFECNCDHGPMQINLLFNRALHTHLHAVKILTSASIYQEMERGEKERTRTMSV